MSHEKNTVYAQARVKDHDLIRGKVLHKRKDALLLYMGPTRHGPKAKIATPDGMISWVHVDKVIVTKTFTEPVTWATYAKRRQAGIEGSSLSSRTVRALKRTRNRRKREAILTADAVSPIQASGQPRPVEGK